MQITKPSDLARIVKTQRQAQGLTQQELANAVGITRQSLARVEGGHGGVSFETVLRLLDRLTLQLETSPAERHPAESPRKTRSTGDRSQPPGASSSTARSVWSGPLNGLVTHAGEAAARTVSQSTTSDALRALLTAVIEAGDPDHSDPTPARAAGSRPRPDTVSHD